MFFIGSYAFRSKEEAINCVRNIKEKYSHGQYLSECDFDILFSLLKRHPNSMEKIGLGVLRIGVFNNGPGRSGTGFGAEQLNGEIYRFSYKICFSSQRRARSERIKEAFREAVREYIIRWKSNTFNKYGNKIVCPITNEVLDKENSEVDHFEPSFSEVLGDFLKLEGLELNQIDIVISNDDNVEARILSDEIKCKWILFHNKKVSLRLISVMGHRVAHGNV